MLYDLGGMFCSFIDVACFILTIELHFAFDEGNLPIVNVVAS